mmetsp:Transcript_42088/g.109122  ORF Transcript_42088/g.109122 Transcript_42088/m.109122 type:complete len:276 (+) Transcript_42088:828-1655(+)
MHRRQLRVDAGRLQGLPQPQAGRGRLCGGVSGPVRGDAGGGQAPAVSGQPGGVLQGGQAVCAPAAPQPPPLHGLHHPAHAVNCHGVHAARQPVPHHGQAQGEGAAGPEAAEVRGAQRCQGHGVSAQPPAAHPSPGPEERQHPGGQLVEGQARRLWAVPDPHQHVHVECRVRGWHAAVDGARGAEEREVRGSGRRIQLRRRPVGGHHGPSTLGGHAPHAGGGGCGLPGPHAPDAHASRLGPGVGRDEHALHVPRPRAAAHLPRHRGDTGRKVQPAC